MYGFASEAVILTFFDHALPEIKTNLFWIIPFNVTKFDSDHNARRLCAENSFSLFTNTFSISTVFKKNRSISLGFSFYVQLVYYLHQLTCGFYFVIINIARITLLRVHFIVVL